MSAEEQLIGAIIKNKDISLILSAGADDFFVTHKDVWQGLKSYYTKYRGVPSAEQLQERFKDFTVPDVEGDTRYYLDNLRDEWLTSQLRAVFLEESRKLKDRDTSVSEIVQKSISRLNDLAKSTDTVRDVSVIDLDSAKEYYEEQAAKSAERGGIPGIPTGFESIDASYPTGMAPGHLIVCIGWPSKGKTWFSAKLAINAWEQGYRPMLMSLEMSPETMRDRVYTMMGQGRFKNSDLVRGAVATDDFGAWGTKRFAGKNDFIIVSAEGFSTVTPSTVAGKIEQHKPDLVVLDYHQLFDDDKGSKSEVERNKNISRAFKRLAVQYGIPIIDITAATADDSGRENAPMLSQVAWSKAIEYDADMAIAVHKGNERNELGEDQVEVICRKNRHGSEFAVDLVWDFNKGTIREMFGDDD